MDENGKRTEPCYADRTYLSVSTLVNFARCPRRYFFDKCGLRGEGLMLAPRYGSAMHIAVPIALGNIQLESSETLKLAMAGFLSSWIEVEEEIEAAGCDDKKGHNRRCAERSLAHYIHTHKDGRSIFKLTLPPEAALPEEMLAVGEKTSPWEVPWAIDIGLDVPLCGFLDATCTHRDTGEPWIWELKTTSRLSSQFFEAHDMYVQNMTYTLVGQTLDVPVAGVMVEGMLKSPKKVDNQIQMVPVQSHHLDAIMVWLHRVGGDLLNCEKTYNNLLEEHDGDMLLASAAFYQDFTGCTPYSHFYMPGWRCDYADLCRVPDWQMLTDLYKVVPDHNFLSVTVDPNATRKASKTK